MRIVIDGPLLANQGPRYARIAHAVALTGSSTRAVGPQLEALLKPPSGTAAGASALRARVERATRHMDVSVRQLEAVSLELRRRAGLTEESPVLAGPQLVQLTARQRSYLFPTGAAAIELKRKLAELARRMAIRPPKGFNPNVGRTGAAARRLIRMIQVARREPPVGAFNRTMRTLLRTIQLPGTWPALLKYPGDGASRQQRACWLAANAAKAGAPPILAIMCAIPESGIANLGGGDRDSVGFFQIRQSIHPVPPGFGAASGTIRSEGWWQEHPEAQMAWWAAEMKRVRPSGMSAQTSNPDQLAAWAYGIERCAAQYRHRYRDAYSEARRLVDHCTTAPTVATGAGGAAAAGAAARPSPYLYPTGAAALVLKSKLEVLARRRGVAIPAGFDPNRPRTGAETRLLLRRVQAKLGLATTGTFNRPMREALLKVKLPGSPYADRLLGVARGELGVRETSPNWGTRVSQYLRSASVTYPAPWCASFVTWSLAQAGDRTPFRSAAVAAWVNAATNREHGMRVVPPGDVRPGDIVAYDWDGGHDYGQAAHIGIVSSQVSGGRFTTIEGNTSSANVSAENRSMGSAPNVLFIRVER